MKRLLMLLMALALLAAACSDDDSAATTGDTTNGTEAPATEAPGTEAPAAGVQAAADACQLGETDGDLNLYNWSEYIPTGSLAEEFEVTDLLAAFEEESGVSVVLTEYDSNETMLAQIDAGVGYDVVVPSDYMVSIMKDAGLLVKLNPAAIPNLSNIAAEFTALPYDPGNQYSAPYQWGTTGIGYAYGSIDDENGVSWGVIFDPEMSAANTGFISLLDDERETMGAALIYLGYSINSTDPAEVDEAAALIKETKDRLAAFSSAGYWDLLTSGETVVSQGWNGDFLAAYDEASTDDYDAYEDFGYAIPTEGAAAWVDTIAIPSTVEHPCSAQTFINFILDGFNGGELTNYNYYASPNAAAEEFIYEEILEDPSIYPSQEVRDRLEFFEDLGDFGTYYADAYSAAKS
ncbi:MAG: spermidine/putrescine ABC transporter substrate-binding protein [Acidimicrobiia bacterium]|nr:spermidine/putrescine ABC transporter substrate-binding protein [Acidimicrobiia bacterium]MDH3470694.1 spermidine/putrescine ABC transporter substrate-binding protein [Acidimicrobiia bacterium]